MPRSPDFGYKNDIPLSTKEKFLIVSREDHHALSESFERPCFITFVKLKTNIVESGVYPPVKRIFSDMAGSEVVIG